MKSRGFTLVEMMVIAPIVILLIGAFIALIVNLTGEVMSSRGSNVITYNLQDALNQIEEDVKLSSTFLAVNNIDISSTKQGYGGDTTNGSTVAFTNIAKSGGSSASLILNGLVTNGNPMSSVTGFVYLANSPNPCNSPAEYSTNRPMSMNIVYFVDSQNTLWRRVLMPSNYTNSAIRCGTAAPWQQPSCTPGYNPATLPFCKANDIRLLDGVAPSDFSIQYFSSASNTTADTTANNPAVTSDTVRNTALQSTPTAAISITARQTIAGRDISRAGTLRVTRLDTNASSIAIDAPPTAVPAVPVVSSTVSDGHNVTFTWPRVSTATSYDLEFRINGGSWQSTPESTDIDNNHRTYTIDNAWHQDTVEARVRATNSIGDSAYGSNSLTIPLWAPLILKGGWTDYASGYGTAAYTMTKSGLVMLKGLVRNSGSPALGDVIGSLPADYKPSGRLLFGVSTSGNVSARADVAPTAEGADIVFSDGGLPGWFSLDTIHFVPASTTNTKVSATLQSGFTNYGGVYEPATYTQDSLTGRVTTQGLLANGTRTNGTVVFTLPAAMRPAKYQHHASRSGTFHHLGIENTNGVLAKGDGSGAYSVNASFLPASVTGWANISLNAATAWVSYDGGATFSTPQYVKTSDNVVQLKGLIRSGSTTYDSVIGTLPAGFRPKGRILQTIPSNGGYARVDVLANGEIHFMGSSNAWYALDGVTFVAEQ